jgi:hypothetical protein
MNAAVARTVRRVLASRGDVQHAVVAEYAAADTVCVDSDIAHVGAVGSEAPNGVASPERHPEAAVWADTHAVGVAVGGVDFGKNAAIRDVTGCQVVVVGSHLLCGGIDVVHSARVGGPAQPIGNGHGLDERAESSTVPREQLAATGFGIHLHGSDDHAPGGVELAVIGAHVGIDGQHDQFFAPGPVPDGGKPVALGHDPAPAVSTRNAPDGGVGPPNDLVVAVAIGCVDLPGKDVDPQQPIVRCVPDWPLALRAAAQDGVGPSALEVFVEGHVALDTHLVSGDRTFEEVGQFLHVLEFHERERVLRPVLLAEA